MNNPFSLESKTIFITGASSGIGRATAIECSKMGAKIIASGRNKERLENTILSLAGEEHESYLGDLSDLSVLEELTNAIPVVDGVVLCAGTSFKVPFKLAKQEKVKFMFDQNFFTPVELLRLLVKKKKIKHGGSVVVLSSVGGSRVFSLGSCSYGASKAALLSMMKYCAKELAIYDIRVNTISPAMVETPLLERSILTEEQKQMDMASYPLKRYGKPEEIAYAAIYLLSDASKWVTGTSLVIDGGASL